MVPVEEHPRLVPTRRDADRETGRQRVEHLVTFRLRFERLDARTVNACIAMMDPLLSAQVKGAGVTQG